MISRSSARTFHRRRRRALPWLTLIAVVGAMGVGQSAFAQAPIEPLGPDTSLISIDAVGSPVAIVRAPERPSSVEILVGDQPATTGTITAMADSGRLIQTVLVIDNGAAASEFLDSFVAAARDYVIAAPPSEEITVWTSGGGPKLRVASTADHDRIESVLANVVSATGGNRMWDTVRGAVLALTDTEVGSTNLVVFAGSEDTDSVSNSTEARGAVLATGLSAFVISSDDPSLPLDALARLVSVSPAGGFKTDADPGVLAGYGTSVSEVVSGTWLIGFSADNLATENQIDITVDGNVFSASYVPGSVTAGSALAPIRIASRGGLPFINGESGKLLGIALGAMAAGLASYTLVMLFQNDPSGLDVTLLPYTEGLAGDIAGVEGQKRSISKNLFVKRAVEITEGLAQRRGTMAKSEALLERADLPLRVGEALSGYAAIVLASAVVGLVVGETLTAMVFFAALGILIPPLFVKTKAGRRRKKFMNQLPDTLQLLSSTLKAGYSFLQGVDAVSQEIADPMATELRRIVAEAQLGRPLEVAMDASAERMDSDDFAWAVMAVRIQREVGGNLAELLLTVSETMTERERLRRDVASLTAEGKMSAIVLGALPILLGFAMWVMNRDYIELLFTDSLGKILLIASVVAALGGFAWMKKIITIDI